jgi:hypothetical protein
VWAIESWILYLLVAGHIAEVTVEYFMLKQSVPDATMEDAMFVSEKLRHGHFHGWHTRSTNYQ